MRVVISSINTALLNTEHFNSRGSNLLPTFIVESHIIYILYKSSCILYILLYILSIMYNILLYVIMYVMIYIHIFCTMEKRYWDICY